MNEVYLGLFARGDDDLPVPMANERLQPENAIAELDETGMLRRIAAGYGWQRYPKLMHLNRSFFCEESSVLYPNARYLLDLAANADAVAPQDIEPAYLRRKVAQIPGTPK